MITYRTRGLLMLHFVAQTAAAVGLFWLWIFVNFSLVRDTTQVAPEQNVTYSLLLIASFAIGFLRLSKSNHNLLELNVFDNHRLSFRQTVTSVLVLLLYLVAVRDQAISRIFLFTFLPVLYIYLFVSNSYFPGLLAACIFGGRRRQRTVLLGPAQSATRLNGWLRKKLSFGFETVGLVTNDASSLESSDLQVLGNVNDLEDILIETRASQLLVVELPRSSARISRLGELCDKLGIRLLIINDLEERIGRSVSFIDDGGFRFLSLRDEPLECPFNQILKRLLDIVVSLPVVFFVLPLTSVLVTIWHRLQSPGPLLFKQRRSGIGGEEFLIYKYRTMHIGPFDESKQATEDDPRVFPAGGWLRKLSIDELPQFINVLKGEMSVVGPRPHLTAHDTLFSNVAQSYKVRALIKPGITGLAQVRGHRGATPLDEDMVNRVRSDLFYLENWTILLDAVIIFKTALQMLIPPRTAQ